MTSVDIPLASVDRNRTKFYLPSENLAQPFSGFPPNRYEARMGEDVQRTAVSTRSRYFEDRSSKKSLPENVIVKPKKSSRSAPSSQQGAGSSARDIQPDVEKVIMLLLIMTLPI